jgi:hypothetical protein
MSKTLHLEGMVEEHVPEKESVNNVTADQRQSKAQRPLIAVVRHSTVITGKKIVMTGRHEEPAALSRLKTKNKKIKKKQIR